MLCLVANKQVAVERRPPLVNAERPLILNRSGAAKGARGVDVGADRQYDVE